MKPGHIWGGDDYCRQMRPTIPLLIIQSNFGEELRVEAGLSSFVHKQTVILGEEQ